MCQDFILKRFDCRGSITVFFSLILAVYIGFSMVLLESARIYGMQWMAQEMNNHAIDSVMAEWNREVREKYELYLLDTGYGSKKQQLCVSEDVYLKYASQLVRVVQGADLFHVEIKEAQIVQVISAMDVGQFQKGIQDALKEDVLEQWKSFFSENREIDEIEMQTKQQDKSIGEQIELWEAFTDPKTDEEKDEIEKAPAKEGAKGMTSKSINLDDMMDEITLQSLIPEGRTISKAKVREADTLPSCLLDGSGHTVSSNPEQKLCLDAYICEKFACFLDETQSQSMQYQMEYILYGKDSDKENLFLVMKHLLWLRFTLNLLHLQSSPEKEIQVQTMATTLTAWNPAVAAFPAVVIMLESLWAWMEARHDVLILLNDGKVPIYKTDLQWHYSLENALDRIGEAGAGDERTQAKQGLSYRQYLALLLSVRSDEKSAMRAMDMIQDDMQGDIPNFYYQNMAVGIIVESTAVGIPMFSAKLSKYEWYRWRQSAQRGYFNME